jgi:DnaJ family protein C protein 7
MKTGGEIANNPKVLCMRGRVLIYNGADILGKKHLVQALNFDPDLKKCQVMMKLGIKAAKMKEDAAEIFKEQKFEEAVTKFEECLALDPMNACYNSTLLLNISICQVKLGKQDLALAALNKAIKFKPKYSKALVKRGEVRIAMEDYNEAIRDFSEASEHDSNGFGVQAKLKDA